MLGPGPGETYLDCTAGLGGHAVAVAERVGPTGTIVLNDLDGSNLERAEARLRAMDECPKVVVLQGNYADAPRRLTEAGLASDMVLADLGFASNQVDDGGRGFSFSRDGPLDMRMDRSQPVTAQELVNTLPAEELARILREFGEERQAGRIARKIVAVRECEPIRTTARLAAVVRAVSGRRAGAIDPATRTFQALRIAVNDELGSLEALLAAVHRTTTRREEGWLAPKARVAIISFHSLEDRPVKRVLGGLVREGLAEDLTHKRGRGMQRADEAEVSANPRARSAKLRAIRVG